jgi:hypothetical protein
VSVFFSLHFFLLSFDLRFILAGGSDIEPSQLSLYARCRLGTGSPSR